MSTVIPTISVYNRAQTLLHSPMDVLVSALQDYVDNYVVPIWNTPAKLQLTNGPVAGTWGFVLYDDADAPGALAYHTEADGLPLAKVFLRTIAQNNESQSGSASHELVEMLVDPTCDKIVTAPDGTVYAYEVADPVEENSFLVQGLQMSDFVFPNWFELEPVDENEKLPVGAIQYSYCHSVYAPFTLANGGYASIIKDGKWGEIHGSDMKMMAFGREDRRGHRSEFRKSKQVGV